jgi:hypothetical protein
MRTSRLRRRRGINVHQQAEEEMDRYAQCTSKPRKRRMDMHLHDKGKRDRCAPAARKRRMDMHQQAKEERDGFAPTGQGS